ncbi:medium-chain fatty acid-CoA ligase faa2 [Coemansia sp. IMI 203386]|nr:medium-chain fatty acid-CoA ligase faa2 [Coemansia sp. IMI 203386]
MAFTDLTIVLPALLATLTGAVYFYYFSPQANQPDIHPLQLAQQSSVSSTRGSSNESAVYRSKSAPEGSSLLATPSREIKTLRDAIHLGRAGSKNAALVQTAADDTKIIKTSSEDFASRTLALAAGFKRILSAETGTASAILYMHSSTELLIAYQACIEAGIVAIPIAATESVNAVQAIIRHARSPLIVTSSALAMGLGARVAGSTLKHAVVLGDLDGSDESVAFGKTAKVVSMKELEQGPAQESDPSIEPSDPAYVLYVASDNGSAPRGVVITHSNALSAMAGLAASLPATLALTSKDSFMSVASLADPTNLNFINLALMHGCPIFICETADSEKFSNFSYQFQPTFTYLEPMILRDLVQLFYSHIVKYPKLEYKIFMSGYRRALNSLMRGMVPKASFFDFSYFRHYRNVIGGKLRLMYVNGPATSSKDIEWLRVLHGAKVIPLFGSVDTCSAVTAGAYFDYASAIETHNVGAPLACCELKVVDSQEPVRLTFKDQPYPRGRILVRGPNVASGRWNEEPASLSDGWLELPHFGEIMPNGTIDVIGTNTTVVKSDLSPSGLIAAERLEQLLTSTRAITDVCLVAPEPAAKHLQIVAHPRPMELFAEAKRSKRSYKMQEIDSYPWCAEYIRDKLMAVAATSPEFSWVAQLPKQDVRVKLVSSPFSAKNKLARSDGTNNRATAKQLAMGA